MLSLNDELLQKNQRKRLKIKMIGIKIKNLIFSKSWLKDKIKNK